MRRYPLRPELTILACFPRYPSTRWRVAICNALGSHFLHRMLMCGKRIETDSSIVGSLLEALRGKFLLTFRNPFFHLVPLR